MTANVFGFLSSLPRPLSHHGSVWVLPVISIFLTNTVSPVQACLIIRWERFRGTQKEDVRVRGPHSIQSSQGGGDGQVTQAIKAR